MIYFVIYVNELFLEKNVNLIRDWLKILGKIGIGYSVKGCSLKWLKWNVFWSFIVKRWFKYNLKRYFNYEIKI